MSEYLGTANFAAYRVWEHFVAVVASGTSPTTGWTHELNQGFVPNNEVWFLSYPPQEYSLQIVTPFEVVKLLSLSKAEEVVRVFHANGNPEEVAIVDAATANRSTQARIEAALPPIAILPSECPLEGDGLPVRLFKGADTPSPQFSFSKATLYYERRLGSFESPEICKCDIKGFEITCTNKHYDAVLKIRVGSAQDVGSAVEECLRDAAIAAAVAAIIAVIATGGAALAAAKSTFLSLFTACLANKLSNVISVDVDVSYECR